MTAKAIGPQAIEFDCEIVCGDFRSVVERAIAILKSLGIDRRGEWKSDQTSSGTEAGFIADLAGLPTSASHPRAAVAYMQFDLGEAGYANAAFFPDADKSGLVRFGLRSTAEGERLDRLLKFQRLATDFITQIFRQLYVYSADLTAIGGGARCIPDVPLVTMNSHIAVTNAREVNDRYDDPEAFWNAGWNVAARHEGQVLLTREIDLLAGPEYLEQIIEHQWAMARASKAGETGYDDPEVLPGEDAVFRAGQARLEFVGYAPDEKLIEYSCYLGQGQHIQGWEIFALREIVATKRTPDDKAPVEVVRVVFLEEWMARSEKRPLLDVGCKVFYYAADGELAEILE
jgi:hypothetical protein